MPQAADQVVRQLLVDQGEDIVPAVKAAIGRLPTADDAARDGVLANDPVWRLFDPDVEWDMSHVGVGGAVHGVNELAVWWSLWISAFGTHSYKVNQWRDLDKCVLTVADVTATARNGQIVDRPAFQLWWVKDEKITVVKGFENEADALAAAQ